MNIPALASESTYIEQRKYFHQATKVLSSQSSKIMDYMLSRFSYNEVAVLRLNNLLFAFCFALQTVFAVVSTRIDIFVLSIRKYVKTQTCSSWELNLQLEILAYT